MLECVPMKKENEMIKLVRNTEVFKELLQSLDEEPLRLFNNICRKFLSTGKAVPDFEVRPSGYIDSLSLKALAEAGLITTSKGGIYSLFEYKPTDKGLELYKEEQ